MSPAETKLFVAKIRILHMSAFSGTLLSLAYLGLHSALTNPTYFTSIVTGLNPTVEGDHLNEVAEIVRDLHSDQGKKGVQAAVIVFMHAGMESALTDTVEAFFEARPHKFYKFITDKKITISELLNLGKDEIIKTKIKEFLSDLERRPVLKKTSTLFTLLENSYSSEKYSFDGERLARIDSLRHQCAHGGADVADFSNFDDDLAYLRETADFFIDAASAALDIKLPQADIKVEQSAAANL